MDTEDQFKHFKQSDGAYRLWCVLCEGQTLIYKRNALARASIERSWIKRHVCELLKKVNQ